MHFNLPPELVNQLIFVVFTAALTALTTLVSLGLHKLNAWADAQMGVKNFDFLKQVAATVVRAIEQSPAFQDFDPAKKKEAAILQLVELAEKYGIPVEPETIDKLIEEAVQRMNSDLGDLSIEPLPL